MIAALVLAAALGGERLWLAALELEGPLEAVVLTLEQAGTTRVAAGLLAGERRTVRVPLAPRSDPTPGAVGAGARPLLEVVGAGAGGGARFVGWAAPGRSFYDELPAGLRARPRPPVANFRARPSVAALLLAGAAFAAGLARRRRVGWVLAAGVLGALACAALPLASARAGDVRVLEGDAASGAWFELRAARGRLAVAGGALERLEVEPAGAAVDWEVELEGAGRGSWTARCAGGVLYALAPLRTGPPLARSGNRYRDFQEVWVRAPDGSWSAHGGWRRREPLAPASADGRPPPGWLAAGLPQGVGVLVARVDGASWVRMTGF